MSEVHKYPVRPLNPWPSPWTWNLWWSKTFLLTTSFRSILAIVPNRDSRGRPCSNHRPQTFTSGALETLFPKQNLENASPAVPPSIETLCANPKTEISFFINVVKKTYLWKFHICDLIRNNLFESRDRHHFVIHSNSYPTETGPLAS